MELEDVRRTWEQLGARDPLWGVLSVPGTEGGKWDVDKFLQLGREEVASVLARLDALGIHVSRQRALDFGCGVGRLTQAFAKHFERVDGVDVARSMIERAESLNDDDRCSFHVNVRDDLALFQDASFDFVYSRLVLMHIPPSLSRRYVAEFVRVLRPGGVAFFQVPSRRSQALRAWLLLKSTARRLKSGQAFAHQRPALPDQRSVAVSQDVDRSAARSHVERTTDRSLSSEDEIRARGVRQRFRVWLGLPPETHAMYCLPSSEVIEIVARADAKLLHVEHGRTDSFYDAQYVIVKLAAA